MLNAHLESGAAKIPEQEAQRLQWEERLKACADDTDPLQVWLGYIKWQQDTCVSGGSLQQLHLLERCAHTFKDDPRYVDSHLYLRVWVDYANCVRDPEPIFDYLYGRQIGQMHALFWLSWAAVLERKRKLDAADKVLTRGELMRAQPEGLIQNKHQQFLHRLKKRIDANEPAQDIRTPVVKERKALNRMTKREAGGVKRPTMQRQAAPLSASQHAGSVRSVQSLENFQIFEDVPAEGTDSLSQNPTAWETGTHTENTKENTAHPTPWNGATLPQARRSRPVSSSQCPFAIHCDADGTYDESELAISRSPSQMLLKEAPGSSCATDLERDPLARFRDDQHLAPPLLSEGGSSRLSAIHAQSLSAEKSGAALTNATPRPSHSTVAKEPPSSREAISTITTSGPRGFRQDLLEYAGEESCFEEARARDKHGYRIATCTAELPQLQVLQCGQLPEPPSSCFSAPIPVLQTALPATPAGAEPFNDTTPQMVSTSRRAANSTCGQQIQGAADMSDTPRPSLKGAALQPVPACAAQARLQDSQSSLPRKGLAPIAAQQDESPKHRSLHLQAPLHSGDPLGVSGNGDASPTINTKVVLADLMGAFQGPLEEDITIMPKGKPAPSQPIGEKCQVAPSTSPLQTLQPSFPHEFSIFDENSQPENFGAANVIKSSKEHELDYEQNSSSSSAPFSIFDENDAASNVQCSVAVTPFSIFDDSAAGAQHSSDRAIESAPGLHENEGSFICDKPSSLTVYDAVSSNAHVPLFPEDDDDTLNAPTIRGILRGVIGGK